MWNSPKMWNRPEDVEQAQRSGTGPKKWNRPKEVEQRKDQQYLSVLKKMGVALDVEQAFDVEQPREVEQRKDQQYCSALFKKNGCRPRCGTSL